MFSNLIKLFISFLKVGSFSFGGAYSLLPLIEKEAVINHHWLTGNEFLKVFGMVEVFPGAISIKYATYIGFKVAGIPGVVAANLGNIIMPATIIMLAGYFFENFNKNIWVMKGFEGIKYAVIGMIAALMYQYAVKNFSDVKGIILVVVGFTLVFFFKLHPAYVVIIAVALAFVIL